MLSETSDWTFMNQMPAALLEVLAVSGGYGCPSCATLPCRAFMAEVKGVGWFWRRGLAFLASRCWCGSELSWSLIRSLLQLNPWNFRLEDRENGHHTLSMYDHDWCPMEIDLDRETASLNRISLSSCSSLLFGYSSSLICVNVFWMQWILNYI